jgi:hypothetical protein
MRHGSKHAFFVVYRPCICRVQNGDKADVGVVTIPPPPKKPQPAHFFRFSMAERKIPIRTCQLHVDTTLTATNVQRTSHRDRSTKHLQHDVEHTDEQYRGGSSNGTLAELQVPTSQHGANTSPRWIPTTPTMQAQDTRLAVPVFPPQSTNTYSRTVLPADLNLPQCQC